MDGRPRATPIGLKIQLCFLAMIHKQNQVLIRTFVPAMASLFGPLTKFCLLIIENSLTSQR
jgi:hypothetical protein